MPEARRITAACAGDRMKKMLVWLLMLCLTCGFALAESDEAQIQRHEWVESMFRAVVGTTFEAETVLRAGMTDEEIAARNAELAAYRADTVNWLLLAFDAADAAVADGGAPKPDAEAQAIQRAWERFLENEYGQIWIETLKNLGAETAEDGLKLSREICAEWLAEIDAARLTEINADYSCWIYAPDSPIDYPIVHGADNEYWLHRLFDGSRNAAGTLFIDYRNLPDFQDPNTLIYGHHMRNGSMFGTFTNYARQIYYDVHPWMLLVTEDEVDLVELMAGYTTSKHDHCYDIAISDAADMRAFIDEAKAKSDFMSGVEAETGDRLVTLSTCAYAFENARYIVIGKLTPVWRDEADAAQSRE